MLHWVSANDQLYGESNEGRRVGRLFIMAIMEYFAVHVFQGGQMGSMGVPATNHMTQSKSGVPLVGEFGIGWTAPAQPSPGTACTAC